MSEHPSAEELLAAIDAEVSSDRGREIQRHVQQCSFCTKRCDALRRTAADVSGLWLGPRPNLDGTLDDVRKHLGRAMKRDVERRQATRVPMVLALTAALLFFAVRYDSALLHKSLLIQRGTLPVRSFTPGMARQIPSEELCAAPPRTPPRISSALRLQVLRDYGMEEVPPEEYELDYLITPELGGLPDRRNLWPEPYGLRSWNAYAKDALEHRLPQLVCRGEIDLATAQNGIASNWIEAYKKYVSSEPPVELQARVLEPMWRVHRTGPALH
jgi:hypothetical protein